MPHKEVNNSTWSQSHKQSSHTLCSTDRTLSLTYTQALQTTVI